MKRFVFTLESVNDIALTQEKQLKQQMQRIEERLRETVLQIERTEAELNAARARCARLLSEGRMDAETLVQYERYFEKLAAALQALLAEKARIEREKQACLQAQIENRKELKTLEKLREKQYEAYLQELRKEEEKTIGDLVAYRSTVQ